MVLNILKKLDELMTFIEEWSLLSIVITALLALFVNVILRYGFNYTLAWSEEFVRIVIIYSTFIGASAAVKEGSMIRIDAIVQLFPKLQPVFSFSSNCLMLIFSGFIIYYGYQMAHLQWVTQQKTIIMQIPLVLVYLILPVMGIMVFFRTIHIMIIDIHNR